MHAILPSLFRPSDTERMSERVLIFPDDMAVGYVTAYRGDAAVIHAAATGRIHVPADNHVHLWLESPIRGLANLNANDIQSVQTQKKTLTDADLARLSHLTGLVGLTCSKGHKVTDEGAAA